MRLRDDGLYSSQPAQNCSQSVYARTEPCIDMGFIWQKIHQFARNTYFRIFDSIDWRLVSPLTEFALGWFHTLNFCVQRYLAHRIHSTCSSEIPLEKKRNREVFSRFTEDEWELTARKKWKKKKNTMNSTLTSWESTFNDGAVLQWAALHCVECVVARKVTDLTKP